MALLSVSVLRLELFDPVLIYLHKLRQFSIQNHISLLLLLLLILVFVSFTNLFAFVYVAIPHKNTDIFFFIVLVDERSEGSILFV